MVGAGFPTSEVAKVLGMSAGQIRGYVQDGLVAPSRGARGEFNFSFGDIVLLKAARELTSTLPSRRVHRALRKLKTQLSSDDDLSRVRITTNGTDVIASDGHSAWNAESGQAVLDFERADPATQLARIAWLRAPEIGADDWYDIGLESEAAGELEDAERAYRRAIELEAAHADARINLGHLLHTGGDPAAAAEHYRRALAARPGDPTAQFDLGVALEDLGDSDGAIAAYEAARTADAHFNAARLYEARGNATAAIRHLTAYKKATREP